MSKKKSVASKRRRQRNRRLLQRGLLSFDRLEDRNLLATFIVTSTADVGAGTLRTAINAANLSPGADDIVFARQLSGAININSQLPTITEDLTIFGPGRDVLAIDANQQSRVINVEGSSVDLTINDPVSYTHLTLPTIYSV